MAKITIVTLCDRNATYWMGAIRGAVSPADQAKIAKRLDVVPEPDENDDDARQCGFTEVVIADSAADFEISDDGFVEEHSWPQDD
jgi:hypothetical protein